MKRRSKIVAFLAYAIGCALVIMVIVKERNHCPLRVHLPKDAELISCEYQGYVDFSTMIVAQGPPEINKEFTDSILESKPDLRFIATGYAGWHEGATWTEERSGPAPFNFYQERPDQVLAIGYQDGILTVIYDSW